jgi:hypothetical protein
LENRNIDLNTKAREAREDKEKGEKNVGGLSSQLASLSEGWSNCMHGVKETLDSMMVAAGGSASSALPGASPEVFGCGFRGSWGWCAP